MLTCDLFKAAKIVYQPKSPKSRDFAALFRKNVSLSLLWPIRARCGRLPCALFYAILYLEDILIEVLGRRTYEARIMAIDSGRRCAPCLGRFGLLSLCGYRPSSAAVL
ncbi:hypothetical protein BACCAP_00753 [Pseudoflavonifractor capillosus ATCC 29799]|uniref:Uncharacterized protein n=1 Tax=Pseudoflavonifractor capillosus ATCC 29799 TaxID=411467 RepID=A6NRC5_9FIRM|nr:hypothetical protein BACCAP_00753 [Pseudoflavonifractor capillosus ATCC 29799]